MGENVFFYFSCDDDKKLAANMIDELQIFSLGSQKLRDGLDTEKPFSVIKAGLGEPNMADFDVLGI